MSISPWAALRARRETCGDHNRLHLAHRVVPAGEDRMRDDRMADIQLDDAVDRRDLLDVRVVQTVTRIDLDAERDAQLHATHHALEFALLLAGVVRFRVA